MRNLNLTSQSFHVIYLLFSKQLESTAKNVTDWFNGTVPIDRSVGNHTAFTITHERSAPTVYIKSPSGLVYNKRNTSQIANTITFTVPETEEVKLFPVKLIKDNKKNPQHEIHNTNK